MNKKKLFIGNLNYSVTERQLRTLLSPYGDIIGVNVMEGKGYAFVEMGTEEQAQNIQRSLSESVFEGRNLLIDGVPGKGKSNRRSDSDSSKTRKTRSVSVTGRGSEDRVHQVEAYERPPKPERKSREPERDSRRPAKPPQSVKAPGSPSKQPEGKRSQTQPAPNRDTSPRSRQDAQKSSPDSVIHEKPAHPAGGTKPPQQNSPKSGKTPQPGRKDERKVQDKKSKPMKEKPPKNPHPYQGSAKQKKPSPSANEPEKQADGQTDTEKKDFLRHWATLAGKKQQ